ncbi:MAG: hypothetical protein ACI9Y1_001075 [Lentisphaeria bacterium]|jgi:hypothetical protein
MAGCILLLNWDIILKNRRSKGTTPNLFSVAGQVKII